MRSLTFCRCGRPEIDELFPIIEEFFQHNFLDIEMDGKKIRGYRSPDAKSIWIRDYSDMMRCFRYFESDLKSCVEHFAETQAENGRIFDYYTVFPEKLPSEKENWAKYVRVPVEADVEYRFVKAAYLAWQATGDDEWIERLLPKMEKALLYVLNHPWRWDKKSRLVKRAYTIDTWDFAYTAGQYHWLQMQITDDTFWGIMHGDNSGYYEAFRLMGQLYSYFNREKRALIWRRLAKKIRRRMNRICWNGQYYTHFVKLTPVTIPGTDEANQLSLSNPIDINRGVTNHKMTVSIINEYLRRRGSTETFAEWFSIDPPFPAGIFGEEKLVPGAYINGGIMPLVGGELARAAFEHGFEWYGVDILRRYFEMIAKKKETYLWYFPDGTPSNIDTSTSPDAMPTDGWGSSAMAYALVEGLWGVIDKQKLFREVELSPRWPAADVEHAEVNVGYASSGASFGYKFDIEDKRILLEINSDKSKIAAHVLLPAEALVKKVLVDDNKTDFKQRKVESSDYVDFELKVRGKCAVEIQLS